MIHLKTEKIIITTDFSETSLLAIKHGAFLAQFTKGEIFLVHIISKHWEKFNVFEPSITLDNVEKASNSIEQKLQELANGITKDYGVKVTPVVNTGNPTNEIVRFAKEINADLIVMGTHGYSAWEDLTIGSNTLKVITKCPCPVLTMSQFVETLGYHKIVMALDMSEHSRHKVPATIDLAKQFSAQIYVIGVLTSDEESKKPSMEVMLKQVEQAAAKAGLICKSELKTNVKNRAVETVNYCKAVEGDLITIMTDQDAELSGFFIGNYALQVIHHSKVPVLSFKPQDHPENVNFSILAGT